VIACSATTTAPSARSRATGASLGIRLDPSSRLISIAGRSLTASSLGAGTRRVSPAPPARGLDGEQLAVVVSAGAHDDAVGRLRQPERHQPRRTAVA
jgi:hypothetical protein